MDRRPLPPFEFFLSYSSEDSQSAERLKFELQNRGVRVWMDKDQIRPGDLFIQALEEGIECSRAVGVILTPKGIASGWVKEEYYRALSLSKSKHTQLIPILAEDVSIPGFLASRQYVDLRGSSRYDRSVDRLVFPGITGKKIMIFFRNALGPFIDLWNEYGNDDIAHPWEATLSRCVADLSGADIYPEPPESWSLRKEVPDVIGRGYETVVVACPFGYWPWREAYSPWQIGLGGETDAESRIREIFDLREITRGAEGETVFALYIQPRALAEARQHIDAAVITRLEHYFQISLTYDEYAAEKRDDVDAGLYADLRLAWKETWLKIQRLLLSNARKNHGRLLGSPESSV